MQYSDLANEIAHALPGEFQAQGLTLAHIISSVISGSISKDEAGSKIAASPEIRRILEFLATKEFKTSDALIHFGSNAQIGDITIGSVVNGHSINISYNEPESKHFKCLQCGTKNPSSGEIKRCVACGQLLYRQCPECGNVKSLLSTNICIDCGYDFETATRRLKYRNEIAQREDRIKQIRAKIQSHEDFIRYGENHIFAIDRDAKNKKQSNRYLTAAFIATVVFVVCGGVLITGEHNKFFSFLSYEIFFDWPQNVRRTLTSVMNFVLYSTLIVSACWMFFVVIAEVREIWKADKAKKRYEIVIADNRTKIGGLAAAEKKLQEQIDSLMKELERTARRETL